MNRGSSVSILLVMDDGLWEGRFGAENAIVFGSQSFL